MQIVGSRANMQCQSYFHLYHSQYDLNVDANGASSPIYNDNATLRSGHYNEYIAPLPLPRGPAFAYKELLRQTMLSQERTFKEQVQELHCLYRRQNELMGEIKSKDMYTPHLHMEDQSSNSTPAKISVSHGQYVYHSLPFINTHSTNNSSSRENIQTSLSSVKDPKPTLSPDASRNGGTLNALEVAGSKAKKIKGKLLDLELPAEVYIDSDEEEFLRATPPTALFSNKRARVVVESDVKPSAVSRSLNSILQGEPPSPCSFSPLNTNLADLNESPPMSGLEETDMNKTKSSLEISEKFHGRSIGGITTPDCAADKSVVTSIAQSSMAKSQALMVQALPSLNSELSSIRGAKISSRHFMMNMKTNASQCGIPNLRVTRSSKNNCPEFRKSVLSPAKNLDLNSIDLNAVADSNQESTRSSNLVFTEGETVKSQQCRMIDINLPCDPTTDDETCDFVAHNYKYSSLDETRLEIDSKAPISPEVEVHPPPRGDSDENQSDEGSDPLVELANIAAEAIVSISSFQNITIISGLQNCEASDSRKLEWFAGLISSLSNDVNNGFETVRCKDNCSIDEYEAMTLELTEMKVEEYWCKSSVQIFSESCSTLLPCQTRRGRMRRSKRKDFRREVLPSLASLSRYEVTEDIQMIEGLMEAAGTPWQLSRTRRACRMGRKLRVAKQQTAVDEAPEVMAVMSWGKVNRRCRGRRCPASPAVLSKKWLEFVI